MKSNHTIFNYLLGNSLVAAVTTTFAWFALTYWVFLQTESLIATSVIAGLFSVSNASLAAVFWNIVDHNYKQRVMTRSAWGSLLFYLWATLLYFSFPESVFTTIASRQLRLFIVLIMAGTIMGNLRMIALSTTVSLLIPTEEHAQANGKVGMINWFSFTITSVISGLAIGFWGMNYVLRWLLAWCILTLLHLHTFTIPETLTEHDDPHAKKFNRRTTVAIISTVPGLFALIFFSTFNNFLGGVFMSLMDPYGLTLMSVQARGILWAVLSSAFIAWWMVVAKKWLWEKPLRTMFLLNIVTRTTCIFFAIQPSVILLSIGIFIWLFCGPFIEATESTVIQKVVPYEKQWRVFGFAQSVEFAASPITAFLIGPLAQLYVIPWMTDGRWAQTFWSRFGTWLDRGIAVVFIVAWFLGLCMTLIALSSRYYRILSSEYAK